MAQRSTWWTVRAERTVSEDIPGPPEVVRAFYVDLRNIISIHPLVVSVTPADPIPNDDGYAQHYRIRDRIPVGPFTISVGYGARVEVPLVGDVYTEARQFPHVRLDGIVSFDADSGGGTRLTERLIITAPRPIAAFTVREAEKAHQAMLLGIQAHFAQT